MLVITHILLLLFPAILFLVTTGFWLWMLIDCVQNMESKDNDKLIWILVLLFTHMLGATLYFFLVHKKRIPLQAGPVHY